MKKLLILPLALGAAFIVAPAQANAAETSTYSTSYASTASSSQVRVRLVTRNVRRGRSVYRETYRVSRYRNGRVVRQLVSRQRVGRVVRY